MSGPFIQGLTLISLIFYFGAAYHQMARMMRLPLPLIFFFPLATALLPFVYLRAAFLATMRGGIKWRGTFYSLNDLKQNQRLKLAELAFMSDTVESRTAPVTTFHPPHSQAPYVPGYKIANDGPVYRTPRV